MKIDGSLALAGLCFDLVIHPSSWFFFVLGLALIGWWIGTAIDYAIRTKREV